MQLEYKGLLNKDLHSGSRVWVYQSSRLFTLGEALEIEGMLKDFQQQWNSHGAPVKSDVHLFFGQFVVLIADETATMVGGCSTDSSVRVIKEIERKFGVHMFDRQALAFVINDKIQLLPLVQFPYAVERGSITPGTLYFNNLVQTKEELENKWLIPVKDSWLAKRVTLSL